MNNPQVNTGVNLPHRQRLDTFQRVKLQELLMLLGISVDVDKIDDQHLDTAIVHLKSLIAPGHQVATGETPRLNVVRAAKRVMLVGQLAIVMHQLKIMLIHEGAEVIIAKDYYEAIRFFQRQDFNLVIVDVETTSTYLDLLTIEDISTLSRLSKMALGIVAIAAGDKDASLRKQAISKGANLFVEKTDGWLEAVKTYYVNGL